MRWSKVLRKQVILIFITALMIFLVCGVVWLSNQSGHIKLKIAPSGPVGNELHIYILKLMHTSKAECSMFSKQSISVSCRGFSSAIEASTSEALADGWQFHRNTTSANYKEATVFRRRNEVLIFEWDDQEVIRIVSIERSF